MLTGHYRASESGSSQRLCSRLCLGHVCMLSCFSRVWLFVTLWTVVFQAPLSMGFSRQEYWSGLPFPPPADLLDPGMELMSLMSLYTGRRVLYYQHHLGSPIILGQGWAKEMHLLYPTGCLLRIPVFHLARGCRTSATAKKDCFILKSLAKVVSGAICLETTPQ